MVWKMTQWQKDKPTNVSLSPSPQKKSYDRPMFRSKCRQLWTEKNLHGTDGFLNKNTNRHLSLIWHRLIAANTKHNKSSCEHLTFSTSYAQFSGQFPLKLRYYYDEFTWITTHKSISTHDNRAHLYARQIDIRAAQPGHQADKNNLTQIKQQWIEVLLRKLKMIDCNIDGIQQTWMWINVAKSCFLLL